MTDMLWLSANDRNDDGGPQDQIKPTWSWLSNHNAVYMPETFLDEKSFVGQILSLPKEQPPDTSHQTDGQVDKCIKIRAPMLRCRSPGPPVRIDPNSRSRTRTIHDEVRSDIEDGAWHADVSRSPT